VKLVNLADKDELIGISKVIASEEEESGEEDEGSQATEGGNSLEASAQEEPTGE
jgi:hypothetical protein